ncbi:MAG: SDR family NAD(P)-dependent oxidoreductase [Leptospira sp.]|nr:SDR family NAD(P)-dependent oxidoreductase [Leptospira sp.]
MKIDSKRIVITGTSSGIGRETFLLLKEYKDAKILCVDFNKAEDNEDFQENINIKFHRADISLPESIEDIVRIANDWMGGIDIFFANAGFAYYEEIQKPNWEKIEKIFKTNVFSPFYTLTYLNHSSKNPFLFIVTASAMSHLPIPGYSLYSSTKSAVHSFMNCFRYELKKGNRLMVVYPIATRSKFFDTAGNSVPIPFPSQSSKAVAKSIIHGIKWNRNSVYPSWIFSLMMVVDRFMIFPLKVYQMIEGFKFKKHNRNIKSI